MSGAESFNAGHALEPVASALVRSFLGRPPEAPLGGVASVPTAVSERGLFPIGQNRAAQMLAREISAYRSLRAGWDGEGALAPVDDAICDAVRFVYAAGRVPGLVSRLETTLNADGTVALEFDGDASGTLAFKGNETVVYVLCGHAPGTVDFFEDAIPAELMRALIG